MIPGPLEVRAGLEEAVRALYRHDAHLIRSRVSERAVVHRLAVHLEEIVGTWDEDWDVDTEYNRVTDYDFGGVAYKYLLDVLGEPVAPAYPDLIVHRRGVSGMNDGNLLVVEAKWMPTERQKRRDHAKLAAWCRELHYKLGARLEISADRAAIAWVDYFTEPVDEPIALGIDLSTDVGDLADE